MDLSRSLRTARQDGTIIESTEPLVGRLGAPAQRGHSCISGNAVKTGCAHQWDAWGRLSGDGPRQYNLDRSSASMLVGVLAGESSARVSCPVARGAISGGGEGDQADGSPEVKILVG